LSNISDRGLKHQFLYLLASSEPHNPKAAAVKHFAEVRLQRAATRSTVRTGLQMIALRSSPQVAKTALIGVRILPVVGYALLAYDLWKLYDSWSDSD